MCSLTYRCPFGVLEMLANERGIYRVNCRPMETPTYNKSVDSSRSDESYNCQCKSSCQAQHALRAASRWLKAYFSGDSVSDEILQMPPLDLSGTSDFTARVLRELTRCTEPGVTITYGDLGKRLGHERAGRAVGNAMRTNPVPLFVPCHRVTLGNGTLGNYSMGHGTLTKEWLLEHERRMAKAVKT